MMMYSEPNRKNRIRAQLLCVFVRMLLLGKYLRFRLKSRRRIFSQIRKTMGGNEIYFRSTLLVSYPFKRGVQFVLSGQAPVLEYYMEKLEHFEMVWNNIFKFECPSPRTFSILVQKCCIL